ncbi:MAG: tetratricopeptide repeat protein [Chitinivibrionia bacterium]|nr:tetratricopeptide repeat protein [Chitinivibrionia bacterium]
MKAKILAIALLLPLLLFNSCSSSRRAGTRSDVQNAIELFVAGRYEAARAEFEGLTKSLNGEDLCAAYLYLGRCYFEMGNLEKAGEVFSTGRVACGEEPFAEHLMQVQNYLRVSPAAIAGAAFITRAQCACLLAYYFGDASAGAPMAQPGIAKDPADAASHWAIGAIREVLRTGLMETLPDGLFHPDEAVTRAAFVFIAGSAIKRFEPGPGTDLEGAFPEGVEQKIGMYAGVAASDGGPFVSGRDAVNLLDNIARNTGHAHE